MSAARSGSTRWPRFVLPELALAAVVGRPPRNARRLSKLRGVNKHAVARSSRELLDAVEAGRAMPTSELRLPDKPDDGPELDAAVALLVAYVAELARAERIEKQLLATRDDVKELVYGRPSRLDRAGGPRSPAPGCTACSTARPSSASSTAAATSASKTDASVSQRVGGELGAEALVVAARKCGDT